MTDINDINVNTFFAQDLQLFFTAKLHQHAQQMECCKNSRMKATARVTKRIQQKPFDFIITSTMKKHKLELYAKLPVKQKLFVDEHPPTKSLVLNTSLEYTQVFVFPAFCLQV